LSTDQTTNLGLPFLMPAQAQKHVTVNESLTRLDALVQLAVESRAVTSQPGSPADGAVWIAPAGKTGPEWGGYTDWSLAYYRDGAWEQITPKEGWRAWVKDEDAMAYWSGSAWSAGLPITTIELGHASDTTLSRSAAGVLAVEGGVVPKENRANTFTQPQLVSVNGSTTPNTAADDFVVRNQSGMSGMSLIGDNASNTFFMIGTSAADNAFNLYYEGGSGDVIFRTTTTVRLQWDASDTAWRLPNALVVGSPTGGAKGNGTINAQAVYDDNALLSCYVFDAALDGRIDLETWDGKVPGRVIPERRETVQVGVELIEGVERPVFEERVVEPERVEPRVHEGAHRFVARLGDAHDPLTLDGYAAHWKEKRHLTSLPNEDRFDPAQGLSTGAWVQRLVETVEIQAVLIEQLNERLKALEGARG
jgi:hypothetical protein